MEVRFIGLCFALLALLLPPVSAPAPLLPLFAQGFTHAVLMG